MKSTTVPPAATVPKVPVKEETTDEFNERMAQKAKEKRAQEKAAAEVKAKADAEGDKRMAENAAYAAELAKEASVLEPTALPRSLLIPRPRKKRPKRRYRFLKHLPERYPPLMLFSLARIIPLMR